jgi:hypothetical protein
MPTIKTNTKLSPGPQALSNIVLAASRLPHLVTLCLTRSVEFLFGESAGNIDQVRGAHLLIVEIGNVKKRNNSSDSATNS